MASSVAGILHLPPRGCWLVPSPCPILCRRHGQTGIVVQEGSLEMGGKLKGSFKKAVFGEMKIQNVFQQDLLSPGGNRKEIKD